MLLDTALLILGLVLLLAGGDALVRGAVALAARLGVAPVLVGLTVVAFGTSAPELVVNLLAAWRGSPDLGFGNVVGSNIANIGLILGASVLLAPAVVHPSLVRRDIPLLVLVSAVTLVLGTVAIFGEGFSRGDGIALLALFAVFLGLALRQALNERALTRLTLAGTAVRTAEQQGGGDPPGGLGAGRILVLHVVGLGGLVLGGELTVRGATDLATAFGIAEAVIGLTLVAIGTSLPELATSVLAARRGQADVAVGNVVGSNLFNLLFVWGTTVTLAPSRLPPWGEADLVTLLGFALVLLLLVRWQPRITRWGGALLLVGYLAYVAWLPLR
jgi:cation:H+ antiporter